MQIFNFQYFQGWVCGILEFIHISKKSIFQYILHYLSLFQYFQHIPVSLATLVKGPGGGSRVKSQIFFVWTYCCSPGYISSFQNGFIFVSTLDGCRDMTRRSQPLFALFGPLYREKGVKKAQISP